MKMERDCKTEIDRMPKNSQTKGLVPVVTLGLLREHAVSKKTIFTDSEIRKLYQETVHQLKEFLGHDVHIGAKY